MSNETNSLPSPSINNIPANTKQSAPLLLQDGTAPTLTTITQGGLYKKPNDTNLYWNTEFGGEVKVTGNSISTAPLYLTDTTTPTVPLTTEGALYKKASDNNLYWDTIGGGEVRVTGQGGVPPVAIVVANISVLASTNYTSNNNGQAGVNGWSALSDGTSNPNLSSYDAGNIQHTIAPSPGGYIQVNLGTGFAIGIYQYTFTLGYSLDRAIATLSEVTTNTTILTGMDTYASGGFMLVSAQFQWTGGTSVPIIMRWTITGHHSGSTGYYLLPFGNVLLTKVG